MDTLLIIAAIILATTVLGVSRYRTVGRLIDRFDAQLEHLREEIAERYDLTSSARLVGLSDAWRSVSDFDYGSVFRDAKELRVLMNYGTRWLSDNRVWLAAREHEDDRVTTFILVDPSSPAVPLIAKKQQIHEEDVRRKLRRMVRQIRNSLGSQPEVLGHSLYSSYSVVMSESHAAFVPYLTSRVRGEVPALIFSAQDDLSFFDTLRRDFEALRLDCVNLELLDGASKGYMERMESRQVDVTPPPDLWTLDDAVPSGADVSDGSQRPDGSGTDDSRFYDDIDG